MKNVWFILIAIFLNGNMFAQVQDNFADGNFSNPVWAGSTSQFIINNAQQLQLNNSVAGSSFLATPFVSVSLDDYQWDVFVKQSFSPSGSNFARIYLVSDQEDFTRALNGYYLQFGESGSNDAIQLFQQTGLLSKSICRGKNGAIASSFALRLKVLHGRAGKWEIWVDYLGGTEFVLEASGVDQTYSNSSFFGFLCVYTSSNASKFYFDDVYAGPQITDVSPPILDSIKVLSSASIDAIFSESLDPVLAETTTNYSVQGIGNPQTAKLQADHRTVNLEFGLNFSNGALSRLSVTSVQDIVGNKMAPSQMSFLFFQSSPLQRKDVIITEIFPDPIPQLGLPEAEFIEIYNRSENPIDLGGWVLSDGTSSVSLSSQIIMPHQYWIISGSSSFDQYSQFGNAIDAGTFLTLNNNSDTLILKSSNGLAIDSLNYSLTWYRDSEKDQGGWTLELIDPNNPCGEEDNWTASEDPMGGTPGKQNSVYANKPDATGPELVKAVPIESNNISLTFNEKLDPLSVNLNSFTLNPLISISKFWFTSRSLRQIQLLLETPLSNRQVYSLAVTGISDCNKNEIQDSADHAEFALPEPADSLDMIINEILFNPKPNGTDFVEIVNHSPKFINLKNWKLANLEDQILTNIQTITDKDFILAPGAYLALTADPNSLKNNYPQGLEGNFYLTSLPSLPDDFGSVTLVNDHGKIIDFFRYDKGFHSDLIKDDDGVSLERISFSNPTNERQNWKSASSQSGFGTPGATNSNAKPDIALPAGSVKIDPEIFIPGSGTRDFASIIYAFDRAGYTANIKIFDQQGHLIKSISNNETLGFDGFFRWDGDRDDGSKARIGYYIVWMEVFDLSGTVSTFRRRVIVATK